MIYIKEQNKTKLHFRRFEFKYLMPIKTADIIIPSLLEHMKLDPYVVNTGKDYYTVNSLYYDSTGFGCYYEKIAGVSARSKFRLRYYNNLEEDSKIFIEIKRKRDNIIIKDRIIENLENTNTIFRTNEYVNYLKNIDTTKKAVLEEFLFAKNYACLKPQLMVSYLRRPLMSKYDDRFRVTFDYNIKTHQAEWFDRKVGPIKDVLTDHLVLELKYNNFLPSWFYDIIQKHRLYRVPYSKYGSSLEAVYPNLIN